MKCESNEGRTFDRSAFHVGVVDYGPDTRYGTAYIQVVFFRGGFFPPADSAGSMAQRDNRHIE
jgi:hypothetical protein